MSTEAAARRLTTVVDHLKVSINPQEEKKTLVPVPREKIQIREWCGAPDDEAYIELDRLCEQGTKNKLKKKLTGSFTWEEMQPQTFAFVAVEEGNDTAHIIGCIRSYHKTATIGGLDRDFGYHFLLRVDPLYRRSGIAFDLSDTLSEHDICNERRIIFGYQLQDNMSSRSFTNRIDNRNTHNVQGVHVGTLGALGWHPDNFQPQFEIPTSFVSSRISNEKAGSAWSNYYTDMIPTDVQELFSHPLYGGSFEVSNVDKPDQPAAGLSVWHIGKMFNCYMQAEGDSFMPAKSVQLFAPYCEEGDDNLRLLLALIKDVTNKLHQAGHDYIYLMVPSNHPVYEYVVENKWAQQTLNWMMKFWVLEEPMVEPFDSPFFYDPREGL